MARQIYIILGAIFFSFLLGNCKQEKEKKQDEKVAEKVNADAKKATDSTNAGIFKFNDKLFNIPSPFQVSYMVKKLNIDYDSDLLNPTDKLSKYETNFEKAINLGIYGANLGYLNIYEQYPDAARYVAAVKTLSKQLGITNSFDKETINKIERNSTNKDSLIHIISKVYREADAYLMDTRQKDLAVFILAGGWVESLFFMTQIAQDKPKQQLLDRIGEQKYIIENLLNLIRPYYGEKSDKADELIMSLTKLASAFDKIQVEYDYEDPRVKAQQKLTVINSDTRIQIASEQLETISKKVASIRNTLTK